MKSFKKFQALRFTVCAFMFSLISVNTIPQTTGDQTDGQGVAVMLIDTDRPAGKIPEAVYGQFLEHINHSVVDGLYAEQVQGSGFEGNDFKTYWEPYGENGSASVVNASFKNGEKSLQLKAEKGKAGIRQGRFFFESGSEYSGSLFISNIEGTLKLTLRVKDSAGKTLKEIPLKATGRVWSETHFSFSLAITDNQALIEIEARGTGTLLVDFISIMRSDLRSNGMIRPDLFNALDGLKAPFIRWPGGSFATIYKWKDGIGPVESRKYNPNTIWGGYSDYYGFGTEEFMELCRRLGSEPLIVLPATGTGPEELKYAMDWVHYLNDPATTESGKARAANGHPEPYNVRYFQIDNEPMNNGFTPERYAEIVNIYGAEIRKIAPGAKIIACGQKRSNDLNWSQKLIDIAGKNFDILGCHNYEYENENYQTGLIRIEDYLIRLADYVRKSGHPDIRLAVLEWGLCRSYDWKAGLHAAGSLIIYERLGNEIEMTCPALLMRNTTDDPTWTAFIYHDHVSWFPGAGYIVEKLFREHYAENYLATTSGTFSDIQNRHVFFDDISQMKPEDWKPGTLDAIATRTGDGKKIVIKAVNYEGKSNTLLTRLQGSNLTDIAGAKLYTISAGISEKASLENPEAIKVSEKNITWSGDMAFILDPYSVAVIEITMK